MNKQKGFQAIILVVVVIVVVALGAGAYYWFTANANTNSKAKNANQNANSQKETASLVNSLTIPKAEASTFAAYVPVPVKITPQVPAISVKEDFSNVTNKGQMEYLISTAEAKAKLLNNGFVVQTGWSDEYYSLYESHRYNYTPSFITVDSLMHNYHLLFDHLLRQAEEGYLIPKLKELNAAMLQAAQNQYQEVKGTAWENAAKRNVGFFSVASVLLDSKVNIPEIVKTEVEQELALIDKHEGITDAIIINLGETAGEVIDTPQGPLTLGKLLEDYSQYIPRGHYDRSDELKAYFKSMMWLGRLTFRLKSPDETRSALLITLLLNEGKNANIWESIYEPTNFFVGKSDDITYLSLKDIVKTAYGQNAALKEVLSDTNGFTAFQQACDKLEPPQINSIPIFQASIQPDREKEIKGFRFMGQRFTIDASVFQRLIYREVGDKTTTCQEFDPTKTGCTQGARCLPKGLDIPAAMGSTEAVNILNSLGESKYACYNENISKMAKYLEALNENIWTQNLYWGWLYALKPLTTPATTGYPSFMQNTAWQRKDLQTYLGSWTELKHDTILYAKQVYAELGGGEPSQYDDRGYVEPRPEVFARLAALTKMTREGLSVRQLASDSMKDSLQKMEDLSLSLKTIAEKELNNEARTNEEYELIRSYGGQLEHFWLEVNKADMDKSGQTQDQYLQANPAALVADVATDPGGTVLEEGTGKINTIYVLVEVEGVVKVAQGGVYSYYEFPWPLSDRLTDQKWRDLLSDAAKAPKMPDWTDSFLYTP